MKLDFNPVIDNKELVPTVIYNAVKDMNSNFQKEILVAEIDPTYAGGTELCEKYNINPKMGANCLIVEGIRGDKKTIAALLVPVGYKYDMNNTVRKALNARMVSVASLDYVLKETSMEYGSITPIGLPKNWLIFIDPLVIENENIIIGGGLKKSKIKIPTSILLSLPNVKVLEGLAKPIN
jgi:prolyl-tRNA editing enzyme YbaK/EbsC (Cys-tRNA(Pro) deacylase)